MSILGSTAGPTLGPTIPRSSSIYTKLPWLPNDDRSWAELDQDLDRISRNIRKKAKIMKKSTSHDSSFYFWMANAEISHLCQVRAAMKSYLQFFLDYDGSEDDYQGLERTQNVVRLILAYRQAEELAKKQADMLPGSRPGLPDIFIKMFTSLSQGLYINPGLGRPVTSDQANMAKNMKEAYCPDAPGGMEGVYWDPIVGQWDKNMHAAQLYAGRQVESMEHIFGPGIIADILSPENGLFLERDIEKALNQGLIAIVPNVGTEQKDKDLPHADLAERLSDWEKTATKEYKVVVLDLDNKLVHAGGAWRDGTEFKTLAQLDERPLKFRTNFRPHARFVWWTFMNAILQTAWRQKQDGKVILRQEVAKAIRYWGTRGRYVKKSKLRGFIDELGPGFESFLENSIEEDDISDTGAVERDAVAVIVSETVFLMKEALKEDGDESEVDYDSDDDSIAEDEYEPLGQN